MQHLEANGAVRHIYIYVIRLLKVTFLDRGLPQLGHTAFLKIPVKLSSTTRPIILYY